MLPRITVWGSKGRSNGMGVGRPPTVITGDWGVIWLLYSTGVRSSARRARSASKRLFVSAPPIETVAAALPTDALVGGGVAPPQPISQTVNSRMVNRMGRDERIIGSLFI